MLPNVGGSRAIAENVNKVLSLVLAMVAIRVGAIPTATQGSGWETTVNKTPDALRSINFPEGRPLRSRLQLVKLIEERIGTCNGKTTVLCACPNTIVSSIILSRSRDVKNMLVKMLRYDFFDIGNFPVTIIGAKVSNF